MAVISRRPRLAQIAVLALALIAAACSLIKPTETPLEKQEHAARLARDGKHADAARVYDDLAAQLPAESDNYELLSAEQWVAAGNIAAAKQALTQVSPQARTKLATPRALVAAEIAYAENDPARAIRELDQIPVPTAPEQAENYYWIRGRSAFLTGHPVEGVRALVERERFINDPGALRANRDELLTRVRTAAERGAPMKAPPKTDAVVVGWLELGPVAVEVERNPAHAAAALDAWKRQFPQHPANTSVLSAAQTQIAVATEYPSQIALLLPLSGRAEAFGVAVRDGFIAAYLQQNAASRPSLKIYDVAAESVSSAYNRAIADGAGFVVGPLLKDEVAAVAPVTGGRTPVLALNFLGETVAPPKNFYQFALLPEDEARMVARRMVADGRLNGVAIVPSGEWGTRVAAAFTEELKSLGGNVLDTGHYDPSQVDFSDLIKTVMQLKPTKVEKGEKPEPPTHRSDAAFIFVAASTAGTARLILPQLKYNYSGDVPVYSTSDSFEPDPNANSDIEGMLFPDMPWMISNDPATAQIRDSVRAAWPAPTARRNRYYAFGFDAYRLVPGLRSSSPAVSSEIAGVSGKLHLDQQNKIRRDLDWAQIRAGAPFVL
jgi:outer membrane PBP1 activator LpoA protein